MADRDEHSELEVADPWQDLREGDGLLIVDVQVDFCPGGLLPISEGDRVVPVLNRWLAGATTRGVPVYASRDWHPAEHPSFQGNGGAWPPHCIQDTPGAGFHPQLALPPTTVKIAKGVRFDQDQYSVFDQTGLAQRLRLDRVRRLWVGGLALDVCVRASVVDALRAGFHVCLLLDATRPVDRNAGVRAVAELQAAGAALVRTATVAEPRAE
jgi:nicotinamidase/pyrazinamidase